MQHPEKWRDTSDPFSLPYRHITLKKILGYPHAGNDVFQAIALYQQQEVEVFIKVARQIGADIRNEIDTIEALGWELAPQILDYDAKKERFLVTLARKGERLSWLLSQGIIRSAREYLFEYGQTLATLHSWKGAWQPVKDRRFFHIRDRSFFEQNQLEAVYRYLTVCQPQEIHRCFCHGDFHYANILWEKRHISAVLDFELSGLGNKEFDIAWALILRPGQQFLTTPEEIGLFLAGYSSRGSFDPEYVRYYMALIYTYFYDIGRDTPGYQAHIRQFFQETCRIPIP